MTCTVCNAPATFQRLMDLVLAGLLWQTCLVYLDDVIVLGRSFDDHLKNLRAVFDCLRQAHLKLQPPKCSFAQKTVVHFGSCGLITGHFNRSIQDREGGCLAYSHQQGSSAAISWPS